MRTCFDNDGRDDMQTAEHHPTEIYASVTDAENVFVRKLIFFTPYSHNAKNTFYPSLRSRQMLQNAPVMANLCTPSG